MLTNGYVWTCVLAVVIISCRANGNQMNESVFSRTNNEQRDWLSTDMRIGNSLEKATVWLLGQRNEDFHWGRLATTHALLALSRSGYNISTPELKLAIKEMDINFLHDRLKNGELELYSHKLIPLAVTLTSLCRRPTDYFDYDLLDGLLDQRRSTDNFTFASELLASCGGDGIIRRAHVRRLVYLLNPKLWSSSSASLDTVSMLLMAAQCVAQHHGQQGIIPFADQVVSELLKKQKWDGSFGSNTISTALAIQALQMKHLSVDVNQTIQAAIEWLISTQREDGSFDSDLMATIEVMLALSPMGGRAHVHTSQCRRDQAIPSTDLASSVNFEFRCNIWVGQPALLRQHFQFEIPANLTIYEALQSAQNRGLLKFESREYAFGHYIVSINDVHEKESTQQRWMIYVLPGDLNSVKPDKKFLMKTAVSSHELKKGEHVLFWYQPVTQH